MKNINILQKIFLKFLIYFFLYFLFNDFTFCEEYLEENFEENVNNNNNNNKTFKNNTISDSSEPEIETKKNWDIKKIIIVTAITISIVGLVYFYFFSGGEPADEIVNETVSSSVGTIVNAKKELPIIYAKDLNWTKYSFYEMFDTANSVNAHLARISDDIEPALVVYNSDCIIVNMSNILLNTINWSTRLSLEQLKNLPDNQLIAFTHFDPLVDNCYYQLFTADKLKELIETYNLKKL